MSLFGKKALGLALVALLGLSAASVYAAQPSAAGATAQKVSMLGGKLAFSLPKGFTATVLPAGSAANGTAGATGTLYSNNDTKTAVIAAENTIPNGQQAKDNDAPFLDAAVAGFLKQQAAALPDFTKQSEKSLTIKGLGVRQIDSSATMGGGKTLNSTLLAASGGRIAVIQVVSRISDKAGHEALMKQILGR